MSYKALKAQTYTKCCRILSVSYFNAPMCKLQIYVYQIQ